MSSAVLEDRTLIALSGEDCVPFLENLVSCQVEGLDIGDVRYGALLTPQGKVMFDFFLVREQEGFTLETHKDIAPELAKKLAFYRLRAKVEIGEIETISVNVDWGSINEGFQDPRHPDMGRRIYRTPTQKAERTFYDTKRVEIGMPEAGYDFALGEVWPHDILMDFNGGVDFSKGCFVGQEVVSRMRHRGTARNRVVLIQTVDGGDLPPPGTAIEADGRECGTLGTVLANRGLALVRTDRVAKAVKLTTDAVEVIASAPEWADFSLKNQEDKA